MPFYNYQVKLKTGKVSAGLIEAESMIAASNTLRKQGGYVVSLNEAAQNAESFLQKLMSFEVEFGPSAKDILNFTSQLAVMIKAGISIRAALEGIADQTESKKFRNILQAVKTDVESGKAFSDALARFPKIFSPLYINMIRASELSGSFAEMLQRIAEYLSQQIETRSQVRGAMIYPIIIGVMAVSTTVFLLTFVLPKFVVIFKGKEDLLPTPTKLILALSGAMCNYWYLFLAGAIAFVWALIWFIHTPTGIVVWDKLKLKLPIIRKLCRCLYISRCMHTMGELVNAGVPILDALKITADIAGNTFYKEMWLDVSDSVEQGKQISAPMTKGDLIPKSVIQMVHSGEESGKLAEVLTDISEHYQKELKNVIRTVTAMIEPLMIVMMGFVVGFIAMSIILPIFKLSSIVKG
ncbi:MAG: type II secretion system F family protein [Sedimentisphaerales bacterium]|nr:type II secretion system F family protein [Sedimentisphaerales bacterium]